MKNINKIRFFVFYSLIFILHNPLYAVLVAQYEFEDILNDSINTYHLEVVGSGAATYSTEAKRGSRSYNFNGVDNYLENASNLHINRSTGTISFWIKAIETNTQRTFIKMSTSEKVEILSKNGTLEAFYDGPGPFDEEDIITTPNIYDNTWHLVTLTFSSSTDSEIFYIDGVATAVDTDEAAKFGIGKRLYVGGEPGTLYTGLMDDLRIYDHELTAAEVLELFTDPVVPVPAVAVPVSPFTYLFFALTIFFIGLKQIKNQKFLIG